HNWLSNFWKHLSGARNEEKPAKIDTDTRNINKKQFADNNNGLPLNNSSQPKKNPYEAIAVVPGNPITRSKVEKLPYEAIAIAPGKPVSDSKCLDCVPKSFFSEVLFTPRNIEKGDKEVENSSKVSKMNVNLNSANDQTKFIKESEGTISHNEQNSEHSEQKEVRITQLTDVNNNESRQEDDG
ncbi:hypothetical protein O9G_006376, partial [Rozella allomycis CSF55]